MVPAPRSFKASKTRHPGCGDLATSKDRTWEAPGGQGFTQGDPALTGHRVVPGGHLWLP